MKNLRVLIVEDEGDLAKLIRTSIKDYFFRVIIANDGKTGLEKYNSFKPDIVISDITMPILDGLEMCKKIKEENDKTSIIILSAYSQQEKLLKAIDIGINKYFIKPFDPDEFVSYLKELSIKINKDKNIELKDGFIFSNSTLNLYKDDILVKLTKREKDFINLLVKNINSLVKLELIKEKLWDEKNISDERVRTFIKRLRVKTSKDLIENVSSSGYMIS
ncbi:response regulator transcription factor [Aliarcobacter thereius]|uniref:Response regulator ArlR n=2 Tax=Aliarcobacter thereius TaxID=544718 RepID=A0A1C0B5M5_9BACT|nr:response regulator transcription factor [Aliarcobacter thereius]OCL91256.1 Response regulator ArlR [Aliarcobacter thereius]OCL95908.1 Response regulator ArlR [Aliarcobacter thereius LMG 24486]OCL98200.1 Response regulator ArlR [Aliarcobacter thereius]QBF16119.1 two-component system response regulator [Aliarcobacter thereius LMG 24486]TLS71817.1 response regulator transcription factor [Aliarcobacter thereius]